MPSCIAATWRIGRIFKNDRAADGRKVVKALFTYTWDGDVGLSQLRRCAT